MTSSPNAFDRRKGAWLLLAGLFLILGPSQIWLGEPVWQRGVGAVARAVGLAGAYWIAVALLGSVERARTRPLLSALASVALPLAVFYQGVMVLSPAYSRGVLLVGSALLSFLVAAPWLLSAQMGAATPILAGGLAVVVGLGVFAQPPTWTTDAGQPADTLFSQHGRLAANHLAVVDDIDRGGGLSRVGEDMLLVTGAGEFFQVQLGKGRFDVVPLSLRAPLNRDVFVEAVGTTAREWRFRVADILAQPSGDSVRVFVSHHYWKADEACFVLRLSETTLPARLGAVATGRNSRPAAPWRTLFETSPCLDVNDHGDPFVGQQAGGRIAALGDGALILTVGDHGFDGVNSKAVLSQATDNHYGKTILIPRDGPARIFTLGHRNPQGLVVTAKGEIWITEHGPRGGDELNLLVDGANYGWPVRTLGGQFEETDWPLNRPAHPGDGFTSAAFAWVPSIGVSNLIEIGTELMPEWQGDFLVASLATRSLYRLHREDGNILFSEPIETGARVRDLAETADGRLLLWFDDGRLSAYTPENAPLDAGYRLGS